MRPARWVRLAAVTALFLAVYFVVPVSADPHGGPVLRAVVTVVLFLLLAASVVTQLRLSVADEAHHLDGLITAIIAVWVVFALTFYVLATRQHGQVAGLETRLDSLYFTASTMLTIGYGDVHATGQVARGLVLLQMLFDVVFVATAAGMISSRVRTAAVRRRDQGPTTQRNPR